MKEAGFFFDLRLAITLVAAKGVELAKAGARSDEAHRADAPVF
jgi:hypothetical protein